MSKPRIVVSRCLIYEACRYNGKIIDVSWRSELEKVAEVITVCPEVMAGLGTPRLPINLFLKEGKVHVIQDETGIDYTDKLDDVSDEFLSTISKVDGFILKGKSPSCGLGTTKIRFGDSIYIASGVFAKKAMDMHGDAVFVDETILNEDGVEAFIRSL
jgi:uncharacterized protein YbbK (DUF523 family)